MGQLLLFIVVAVVVAAIVFGVTVMLSGGDSGLTPVEADGRAVPLPSDRPLGEDDISHTKFDVTWRGYRMAQVDQALQRAAYDIGYKGELIGVLEAEVLALREGRVADADVLRRAREAAVAPVTSGGAPVETTDGQVIELSVAPAGEVVDDKIVDNRVLDDKAPSDRTSGDRASGDRASGDRAPGDRASGDRAPGDEIPGDELPGDEASVDKVPGEENAVEVVPGDGAVEESEAAERR
jgi:DivIVA domain-containing protein